MGKSIKQYSVYLDWESWLRQTEGRQAREKNQYQVWRKELWSFWGDALNILWCRHNQRFWNERIYFWYQIWFYMWDLYFDFVLQHIYVNGASVNVIRRSPHNHKLKENLSCRVIRHGVDGVEDPDSCCINKRDQVLMITADILSNYPAMCSDGSGKHISLLNCQFQV